MYYRKYEEQIRREQMHVQEAVRLLSITQYRVLKMKHEENLSFEEIADELKICVCESKYLYDHAQRIVMHYILKVSQD